MDWLKEIWLQAGAVGVLVVILVYILKHMEERMSSLVTTMLQEYKEAIDKCNDEKQFCLEKWMEHAKHIQERDAELLAAFHKSNEVATELVKLINWCKVKNNSVL